MPTLITVTPAKDRRHLHYGDKGPDVRAFQRMLRRYLEALGIHAMNRQGGVYGQGTLHDVLRLQAHLGYRPLNGVVDVGMWQAVDPQMHLWERLLLKLKLPPPAALGSKIAHQMLVMVALGMPFYSQRRPAVGTLAEWRRIGSDCSASAYLARAIVLQVIYNGYGNTQTMWQEWEHIDEANVQVGDHVLYGPPYATKHVAVVTDVKSKTVAGFGYAPGGMSTAHARSDFLGYVRPR